MKGEFAKIFDIEGQQVLVHADKSGTDDPCITASIQAPVGRIDACISFKDTDAGWDKRDEKMRAILEGDDRLARAAYKQAMELTSL